MYIWIYRCGYTGVYSHIIQSTYVGRMIKFTNTEKKNLFRRRHFYFTTVIEILVNEHISLAF